MSASQALQEARWKMDIRMEWGIGAIVILPVNSPQAHPEAGIVKELDSFLLYGCFNDY
jgi:hypothetical protein